MHRPGYGQKWQAAEHRIGRLIRLGIRKSHYFGQTKTFFQVMLAATVANLVLTAPKIKKMRSRTGAHDLASSLSSLLRLGSEALLTNLRRRLTSLVQSRVAFRPLRPAFRLGFWSICIPPSLSELWLSRTAVCPQPSG